MDQKKKDLIEAAINFWADKFTKPTYGDRENGQLAGFESMLATRVRLLANTNTEITSAKIDVFRDSLRKILTEKSSIVKKCTLDTDWAPEYPLSDCLREAELPNTFFPLQTIMWINFEKHTVSVGSVGRNESKQIYPQI